jgi:acetyl-CoA carboxylase carboxyl transferase subunit beta
MKEIFKRHPRYAHAPEDFSSLPDNLWVRCPRCQELLYAKEQEQALKVCSKCKYHFQLGARERIDMLVDKDSFQEYDPGIRSRDPLQFRSPGSSYAEKLSANSAEAGTTEAYLYGAATIDGQSVVLGVTEFSFLGGSMGAAVGEKVARAMDLARERGVPLVLVSSGGGARMQEGVVSLMQMAKTLAALDRLKDAGLPFFSIMVDPCLGGTTASYAMMGDVNIAEPGAYIGFAGRRVIEQTMRQKLPQDAATAEFLQRHGMIDLVVHRAELPATVGRLARLYLTCNPTRTERRLVGQPA